MKILPSAEEVLIKLSATFKSKCFGIKLFFLPLKCEFYGTDHLLLNLKQNGEF